MVFAECIQKNRGPNNTVSSYVLQSLKGQTMTITGQQLKQAILNKQIDLDNLRVSKDGKIVDREKGYYAFSRSYCDEQNCKVYVVIRMRQNRTTYHDKCGAAEELYLSEQDFSDAVNAKYIKVSRNDSSGIRVFMRLYPISRYEWESASITEDDYWGVIDKAIKYSSIKDLREDPMDDEQFKKFCIALKNEIFMHMTKSQAIGFCKMSREIHKKYYEKHENEKLPIWWQIMIENYGFCSDDTYNDYVYALMALGKNAFYKFYRDPTQKCFKKYSRILEDNDCESVGGALTCISEDRLFDW